MERKFKDGSTIGNGMFAGETAMSILQMTVLITALEFEIKTGMTMGRVSALKSAEYLSGVGSKGFGIGKKGRGKALEWAKAERNRLENTEVPPTPFCWICDDCQIIDWVDTRQQAVTGAQNHADDFNHEVEMYEQPVEDN